MSQPNFLYIGPDKSGSSWIYKLLRDHPQCFVPTIKDLYFFDRYYDRGLDWYLGHFREADSRHRAIGELSHDYLFSEEACRRIHRDLPEAKVFCCLRHPVERSFSQYLYIRRSGMTRGTFAEAVLQYPEIITNSQYARHLRPYLELFPQNRMGIFLFDELQKNPASFAGKICAFLGIDVPEELPGRERGAGAARNWMIARGMKVAANSARALGLARLVGTAKEGFLGRILYREFREGERPEMTAQEWTMVADAVREDLEDLKQLLPGQVPDWSLEGAR